MISGCPRLALELTSMPAMMLLLLTVGTLLLLRISILTCMHHQHKTLKKKGI